MPVIITVRFTIAASHADKNVFPERVVFYPEIGSLISGILSVHPGILFSDQGKCFRGGLVPVKNQFGEISVLINLKSIYL